MEQPTQTVLHRIPVKTQWRGTTDVNHFTDTIKAVSGENILEARLRGRRLFGRRLHVPAGYTGEVVLLPNALREPPQQIGSDEEARPMGKRGRDDDEEEGGEPAAAPTSSLVDLGPTTVLHTFDDYVVWDHDKAPRGAQAAGVQLWTDLAAVIHGAAPAAPQEPQESLETPVRPPLVATAMDTTSATQHAKSGDTEGNGEENGNGTV